MGTRRSRHNKGRKPLYKEHRRNLVHGWEETDDESADGIRPDDFLLSDAAKALTREQVDRHSEDEAFALFKSLRWPDGPRCPRCNCDRLYDIKRRRALCCVSCRTQFTMTSGTAFGSRKLPFKKILQAIVEFLSVNSDKPLVERAQSLGVDYRTAHLLSQRLKSALEPTDDLGREYRLDRPLYGGAWLSTRCWWKPGEKSALRRFVDMKADLDDVANALGRSPSSVRGYAQEMRLHLPPTWRVATRNTVKRLELQYPYIQKTRPEHADLLEVNRLVPRCFGGDLRGDICQEIMLALYEGQTSMEELRSNRDNIRFFVKKFWKDNFEQSGRSISLSAFDDEARSYDEIASGIAAREWREQEMNDKRLSWDALDSRYNPPTQIDDIFVGEVRDYQRHKHSIGEHLPFVEAVNDLEDENYSRPPGLIDRGHRHRFNGGDHDDEPWRKEARAALWREQRGRCCYCKRLTRLPEDATMPSELSLATLEHRRALSLGGSWGRSNLAMSCEPCNTKKGGRSEKAFLAEISA